MEEKSSRCFWVQLPLRFFFSVPRTGLFDFCMKSSFSRCHVFSCFIETRNTKGISKNGLEGNGSPDNQNRKHLDWDI